MIDFESLCHALLEELDLAGRDDILDISTLDGGVSSDIAVVSLRDRKICIKRALPTLRVAASWHAPVHRNATEYRWLSMVAQRWPGVVPALYGHSESLAAFAMAYLDPQHHKTWKKLLLAGHIDPNAGLQMGQILGAIHAASTQPSFDATGFQNKADFHALRLEPYLEFTASRHPALSDTLMKLSRDCHHASIALVHGDVSPKNILIGPGGPVLLDAECAVMGDPAFDLAFCLNHFLLKAVHLPDHASALLGLAEGFWQAYLGNISWERSEALEKRVSALLPALLLARVDGKSPAEYLDEAQRNLIRSKAIALLEKSPRQLASVFSSFSC